MRRSMLFFLLLLKDSGFNRFLPIVPVHAHNFLGHFLCFPLYIQVQYFHQWICLRILPTCVALPTKSDRVPLGMIVWAARQSKSLHCDGTQCVRAVPNLIVSYLAGTHTSHCIGTGSDLEDGAINVMDRWGVEILYRNFAEAVSVFLARNVAYNRTRRCSGCNWGNLALMDEVVQNEYLISSSFCSFLVEKQVK